MQFVTCECYHKLMKIMKVAELEHKDTLQCCKKIFIEFTLPIKNSGDHQAIETP